MSNSIKQIQASYHPVEDRILLKLHTGQQSLQAWITRRYLKLLIPAIQGIHPKTGDAMFEPKKQAVSEMQSQQVQSQGNYEKPYEEPKEIEQPLGEAPILLAKMTFKNLNSENPEILLEPEVGAGLALSYSPMLLGALHKILGQTLEKTDWMLELAPIMELPKQTTVH